MFRLISEKMQFVSLDYAIQSVVASTFECDHRQTIRWRFKFQMADSSIQGYRKLLIKELRIAFDAWRHSQSRLEPIRVV